MPRRVLPTKERETMRTKWLLIGVGLLTAVLAVAATASELAQAASSGAA